MLRTGHGGQYIHTQLVSPPQGRPRNFGWLIINWRCILFEDPRGPTQTRPVRDHYKGPWVMGKDMTQMREEQQGWSREGWERGPGRWERKAHIWGSWTRVETTQGPAWGRTFHCDRHSVPAERQEGLDVSDFPTTFPSGSLMFRLMTSSQSWEASLGSCGS